MSRRKRASRRPVAPGGRRQFFAMLAAQTGQTVEEVATQIETAVRLGWLIETADGWQAALPADVAPADWTGPVT